MRIAIVHFHLQTGGVTRVIEHACRALRSAGHQIAVLSGEPPQHPDALDAAVTVLPELAYEERRAPASPDELRRAFERAAFESLGSVPDLWHVHNHCLGKNLSLPEALCQLAEQGHALLLQPHDYAEDGRPALYRRMLEHIGDQDGARLSALLYPLAPQIHYAALNARDHAFLAAAGVPEPRLHRLPNAVSLGGARDDSQTISASARRRWLYPTRAIRRKNIGELLLWAALAESDDEYATTQAPQNPAELPFYRRWVALSEELRLPVRFALGAQTSDFQALLESSHALITTSVAEGFGLAFLEPWLIGRPLAGRDLPEITRDFRADGLDLECLYQRLPVPLSWIDGAALRQRFNDALASAARAYGRQRAPDDLDRAWHAAVDADACIDFGRLDETAQEQVVRHLCSTPSAAAGLERGSPPLPAGAKQLEHNRAVVERGYLIAGYRARLETIYQDLLSARPGRIEGHASGARLIDRFQAPERLYLLRT
jgi:glycosyltransferase involved in cell wall biosynthesis